MKKIHSLRPVAPLIGAATALAGLLVAAALATGSSPAVADDPARASTATSGSASSTSTSAPSAATEIGTRPRPNQKGGYTVRVPDGMRVTTSGPTTQIVTPDKSLVVTVAPTKRVDPALGNAQVITAMESAYKSVRTVRHEPGRIDGRRAVTSYGTAVTKQGVAVRFALVSVVDRTKSYAISTFTAADSDKASVLPRVQAIVNGFRIG